MPELGVVSGPLLGTVSVRVLGVEIRPELGVILGPFLGTDSVRELGVVSGS